MNQEQFKQFISQQIPIAWIAGVRLAHYETHKAQTYVELDFFNQNPFQSMFWAVQGMAAEFAGGLMLLTKTQQTGQAIATLIVGIETVFTKKAIGKIVFTCDQGKLIEEKIQEAIETKMGVLLPLSSIGIDEAGDEVAKFLFTWSIKAK